MIRKFRVEDGKGRYALIREENGLFDVHVWEVSHGITPDGERVDDLYLWGSYELAGKLYEGKRADYGATVDGSLACVEGLRMTLAHFDMKLPAILLAEMLAGLNDRANDLKSWMAEEVEKLGHDPRLVWLLGRVSYEVMYGKAAGGGFDEVEIVAIEAIAKELGATENQLKMILPEDWKSPCE